MAYSPVPITSSLLAWVIALLLAGAAPPDHPTTKPGSSLADQGDATVKLIDKYLRADDGGYYQEVRPPSSNFRPRHAFNWAMGIQFSALNAAARLDPPRYQHAVAEFIKHLDGYWCHAHGTAGYAAAIHPAADDPDRYYDDNAWIVLDLLDAYDLTHDPAYLDRARQAADFVFSGEDQVLGGGLYWREREKKSKHTCSNAPAIVCALRLFAITKDPRYESLANRLYAWTNARLQDPDDGLFFDNVRLDGHVDRTKYSYNSALMIRANVLFFDVTRDPRYLAEAQRIATSAVARWCKPDGRVSDPSYFAHLLAEALLELAARDHDPRWPALVQHTADFLWTANRDPAGVHPEHWDVTPTAPLDKIQLMPQSSAARLFFRLAIFQRDKR